MVNQKHTNQEFLYVLLFHIVAFHCTILTNTQLTFLKLEKNNAKSSTTFSNYIRNVPIEDDEIMVSFDVTSLYTNIPIIDTLNIIKDYVNNDHQFTRKTAIPQDKFLDPVHLVLTTTLYNFNSEFYQQTDNHLRCPMMGEVSLET